MVEKSDKPEVLGDPFKCIRVYGSHVSTQLLEQMDIIRSTSLVRFMISSNTQEELSVYFEYQESNLQLSDWIFQLYRL